MKVGTVNCRFGLVQRGCELRWTVKPFSALRENPSTGVTFFFA